MKEEYLDIVDENNNPTGRTGTRAEVHARGWLHRTVDVYFYRYFADKIQILAHLRSQSKESNPNTWDPCFGGHIKSGETVEVTAVKEVAEEVGLTINQSDLESFQWWKSLKKHHFNKMFFYKFSGQEKDLHFVDNEVQAVRWMTLEEIKQDLEAHPEQWNATIASFQKVIDYFKDHAA